MRPLKAVPNEVRFKVRHQALLLNRFTADQVVAATGLNRLSVRTELQRLKREGYLAVTRQKGARPGPGAPRCLYQVVPDPEKALELAESVAAFYRGTVAGEILRPDSRHFRVAARIIRDVATKPLEQAQRQAFLTEAAEHLDFAEVEEGARREGREAIQGYIALERGKLADLRGDLEEAARHFQKSQAAFQAANQPEKAGEARDHLLDLQLKPEGLITIAGESERALLPRFVEAIQRIIGKPGALYTDNPLAPSLAEWAVLLAPLCQSFENWQAKLRKFIKEEARAGASEAVISILRFETLEEEALLRILEKRARLTGLGHQLSVPPLEHQRFLERGPDYLEDIPTSTRQSRRRVN